MNNKNKVEKISKVISKNTDFLQKTFKVRKIGVFGSFSRGDQSRKSDIDMLVELSQPISLFKFVELQDYLSKILKRKVDLTTKDALKPAIKQEVLKDTIYV